MLQSDKDVEVWLKRQHMLDGLKTAGKVAGVVAAAAFLAWNEFRDRDDDPGKGA